MEESKSEKIMNIAKKRAFFYPSAEIYKPTAGFWTYGHLGTRIKQKWENLWRKQFLGLSPYYFEIDDCNILPEKVFKASGHLEHFNDPLVECKKCHQRFRADSLVEDALKIEAEGLDEKALTKLIEDNKLLCPKCQSQFNEVKWFNMMFDVKVGATDTTTLYLRPETAQSPFLAFKKEFEALRKRLPFGLAIIGKAYRNEISPRQGFFRLREFTQAELQIFFDPDNINEHEDFDDVKDYKVKIKLSKNKTVKDYTCEDVNKKLKIPKFYVYHMAQIQKFYFEQLEIPEKKFRFRELNEKERAFYNKIHFDIELDMESLGGFKEVAGLHYRGDHDLGGHQKGSNEKMSVVVGDKRILPHVLELSFGVDRHVWALMDINYQEDKERTYFKFPTLIAPFDVAVFPLVNKEKLPKISKDIFKDLTKEFNVFYDDKASIGKRYRRQDEVGTKYCITVDFDSDKDKTVTLRERDSMTQVRIKIDKLKPTLLALKYDALDFKKAGKNVK